MERVVDTSAPFPHLLFGLLKTHHLPSPFIIQLQPQAAETGAQGQWLDGAQGWNPFVACPIDPLALVLYVEKPDSESRGDQQNRQLHQQIGLEADGQARRNHDNDQGQVGEDHAHDVALFRTFAWPAVAQQKMVAGAKAEHDDGMTIEQVGEALPQRGGAVYVDRQCPDIADATPVEVADPDVMPGVGAAPVTEGSEGEDAAEMADVSVPERRGEEGAVGARFSVKDFTKRGK